MHCKNSGYFIFTFKYAQYLHLTSDNSTFYCLFCLGDRNLIIA